MLLDLVYKVIVLTHVQLVNMRVMDSAPYVISHANHVNKILSIVINALKGIFKLMITNVFIVAPKDIIMIICQEIVYHVRMAVKNVCQILSVLNATIQPLLWLVGSVKKDVQLIQI